MATRTCTACQGRGFVDVTPQSQPTASRTYLQKRSELALVSKEFKSGRATQEQVDYARAELVVANIERAVHDHISVWGPLTPELSSRLLALLPA